MGKVNQELINVIGKNIKQIRESRNISRKDLIPHLGVSIQALSQYENCKRLPNDEMLNRLAKALDVSVEELLGIQKLSPNEKTYINEKTGKVTHDLAYKEVENRIPKQDIWSTLMDMQKYAYDKSNFYIGLDGQEYKELLDEVIKTINNHAFKIELKRQGKI